MLGRLVDKSASVVALPSLKTNSRDRKIDGRRGRTFGAFFKCPRARLQVISAGTGSLCPRQPQSSRSACNGSVAWRRGGERVRLGKGLERPKRDSQRTVSDSWILARDGNQ